MTKVMKFEDAMKSLEDIVIDLETGELSLDESIEKFEQGMKLAKKCSKELDDAERKISMLIEKNGEYEQVSFEKAEE